MPTSASFLAIGILVAADARLAPGVVGTIAIVMGLLHGGYNGAAMAEAGLGALGLVGIATLLFVTVAIAAALVVALRSALGADRRARGRQLDRRDRPPDARLVAAGVIPGRINRNSVPLPARLLQFLALPYARCIDSNRARIPSPTACRLH